MTKKTTTWGEDFKQIEAFAVECKENIVKRLNGTKKAYESLP